MQKKKKVMPEGNTEFEAHLLGIVEKYIPILLLQRHTFEVALGCNDPESLFELVFMYPYLNNRIRYSDKAVEDWKGGRDLVPYVVHEMCHVITDPLYAKAIQRYVSVKEVSDTRETLTDNICNIVLNKELTQ